MRPPVMAADRLRVRSLYAALAVAAALNLGACQDSNSSGRQVVTESASHGRYTADNTTESTPPVSVGTQELTAEEALAINPPPPTDVHIDSVTRKSVELRWEPPRPVSVPHHYSDTVVAYRIYRRVDRAIDFRPLALTEAEAYVDHAVRPGHTYAYVVSSVRESHLEGSRSDPPVEATIGR
jgi:fibronectin type 3 domain-containing protein